MIGCLSGNNTDGILVPFRRRHRCIYTLGYGNQTVSFVLPGSIQPDILSYAESSAVDPDLIRKALSRPIHSSRLSELAQGKKNAVILISDGTRLCPSYLLLPHLLDELNQGGIPDSAITVIVALGMHRVHTLSELIKLVGEDTWKRVTVRNHSALEQDCVELGRTSRGTPVIINRHVVEADLRIVTGNIEPHRLAGMSGGIKAVIPGCASKRCIESNHALSRLAKAIPGDIQNPVREDMEEAQRYLPVHFLLNVVVNHKREVIAAAAGDPVEAHRSLFDYARSSFLIDPPQEPYDLIIASAGGAPKDLQLYQAVKTLQNAAALLKPDGAILLAAECKEHYGNGIMQLWVETIGDRGRILRALEQQFILGAHKLQHLLGIVDKHPVWLYSAIPAAILDLLGFQPGEETFQATLDHIIARMTVYERLPRTAIMPYGALTFAKEPSESVADALETKLLELSPMGR